ncbi:unnamed protein product [Nippostrongylus brasiliensis]|uniref:Ovule protein n=1 Tax=Nippostrongylus brasiliensis TaxID=27835 RepID=A0A0N4XX54_NIPBR|nr:unnamed protein product [Nippostrongylus brasiliensis]
MEKTVTSYGYMTQRVIVKAMASAVTDAHSQTPVSGEGMRGSSMQQGRHRGVTKLVRKCQSDVVSKQGRSKKDNIEGLASKP